MTSCIVKQLFLVCEPPASSAQLITPLIPWIALIYCGFSISDYFKSPSHHIKLSVQEKTVTLAVTKTTAPRLFCIRVCVHGWRLATVDFCLIAGTPAVSTRYSLSHSHYLLLTPSFFSHSFWQSALQLLLPPSPYCLTAFLSFLQASCD